MAAIKYKIPYQINCYKTYDKEYPVNFIKAMNCEKTHLPELSNMISKNKPTYNWVKSGYMGTKKYIKI